MDQRYTKTQMTYWNLAAHDDVITVTSALHRITRCVRAVNRRIATRKLRLLTYPELN